MNVLNVQSNSRCCPRFGLAAFAAIALAVFTGCNVLDPYIPHPVHFRFATTEDMQSEKSMDRLAKFLQVVLREEAIAITNIDEKAESIQICGKKDGLEYIFDIKKAGEGSTLHAEVNQVGNNKDLWGIMKRLDSFP